MRYGLVWLNASVESGDFGDQTVSVTAVENANEFRLIELNVVTTPSIRPLLWAEIKKLNLEAVKALQKVIDKK